MAALHERPAAGAAQNGCQVREHEPAGPSRAPAVQRAAFTKLVQAADQELCVTIWGEPQPRTALLIHGYADQGPAWEPLAHALLAGGVRVVAPDLRGHGLSAPLPTDHETSLADFVADLLALCHQLSLSELTLVGHSLGSLVASAFAASFPERVAELHLIEPMFPVQVAAPIAGRLRRAVIARSQASLPSTTFASEAQAFERYRRMHPNMPKELATRLSQRLLMPCAGGFCWRGSVARLWLGDWITRADALKLLSEVRAKTTFTFARDSNRIRAEDAAALRAALPGATVLTVAGSHNVHYENPLPIAAAILAEASRAAE